MVSSMARRYPVGFEIIDGWSNAITNNGPTNDNGTDIKCDSIDNDFETFDPLPDTLTAPEYRP